MSFNFASIERRIADLESNRGGSLRFGIITEVSEADGTARVHLPDGQGLVSMPLRVLHPRSTKDTPQLLPDVGDPVACLFSGQGFEQGVILGAYYHGHNPSPDQPSGIDYKKYSDGTELWYDRTEHKLVAKVKGDVEMEIDGALRAYTKTEIDLRSESAILLQAPKIALEGNLAQRGLNGSAAVSELKGSYTVRDGFIHVPDHDVTAGAVSLVAHAHQNVQPGPGVSGIPVGYSGSTGDVQRVLNPQRFTQNELDLLLMMALHMGLDVSGFTYEKLLAYLYENAPGVLFAVEPTSRSLLSQDPQPEASLLFDGERLYWLQEGNDVSWPAYSGNEDFWRNKRFSVEDQKKKDAGPLPAGRYLVAQDRYQILPVNDLWQESYSLAKRGKWGGWYTAWGAQRVWIEPIMGTDTYGRDHFSIHGGKIPGSAGCIDLVELMPYFAYNFLSYGKDMTLVVNY